MGKDHGVKHGSIIEQLALLRKCKIYNAEATAPGRHQAFGLRDNNRRPRSENRTWGTERFVAVRCG